MSTHATSEPITAEAMVRRVLKAAIQDGLVEAGLEPYDDVDAWTAGDLVGPANELVECLKELDAWRANEDTR